MKQYYALKHPEHGLLGFTWFETGENPLYCVSVGFSLEVNQNNIWTIDDKEKAQHAANTNTEFAFRDYETPANRFAGTLEVVLLNPLTINQKD